MVLSRQPRWPMKMARNPKMQMTRQSEELDRWRRLPLLKDFDSKRAAFTQTDLLTLIVTLGLLVGWFGLTHFGERGRIAQCSWNLRRLGQAMQSFANDHDSGLPPAGIETPAITWDMELLPYLRPDLVHSNALPTMKQLQQADSVFFCPSDPLRRGDRPRSYAMSTHDMKLDNWPPGLNNATGVGLWWGNGEVRSLLGNRAPEHLPQDLDALCLVKLSWMPDPANTLLLTEYINRQNRLGSVDAIRLGSVAQQMVAFQGRDFSDFQFGQFNYLMVDGHVELLSPLRLSPFPVIPSAAASGVWSIKAGD